MKAQDTVLLNGGEPVVEWFHEHDELPLPLEGFVAVTGATDELVDAGFSLVCEQYRDDYPGIMRDVTESLEQPQLPILGSQGASLMRQKRMVVMVPLLNDIKHVANFGKEIKECLDTLHKHAHEYRCVVILGLRSEETYQGHLMSQGLRDLSTVILTTLSSEDEGSEVEFSVTQYK